MSTLYLIQYDDGVELSAYHPDDDKYENNCVKISKLDNTITLPEAIRNVLVNIFRAADITVIEY